MPRNTKRETFLKRHSEIRLEEQLQRVEKRVPNFWDELCAIENHYKRSITNYKSKLSVILDELSKADAHIIHSVRCRIKDTDSLSVKLIEKAALVPMVDMGNPEIEKYRDISHDNYYKIITDLIGVRVLIRYRYQWEQVHKLIWELYHQDEREYICDWVAEYCSDPGCRFIAEQPKAYIKQESDRGIYEAIGKNLFRILPSDNRYASLHYIVNIGGTYVELQVRTIFDEAWCECSHDFVYKAKVSSQNKRDTLEHLSIILGQHTTASEEIVSLMCDLAKPSHMKSKMGVTSQKATIQPAYSHHRHSREDFSRIMRRAECQSQALK